MSRQGPTNPKKPTSQPATAPTSGPATSPASAVRPAGTIEAKPSTDAIRKRAYEIYLERQRTGKPGSQHTDWTQAEQELSKR